MLSGRSYHRALRLLCNASDGGRVWHNRIPRLRPSTGFYAVAFALDSCSSVSLFGFGDEPPCAPHHYWDPPLLASECNASAAPAQLGQVALEEALQVGAIRHAPGFPLGAVPDNVRKGFTHTHTHTHSEDMRRRNAG